VKPSRRRPVVEFLRGASRVNQRHACRVADVACSTHRHQSRREPRTALRLRIREIAQVRVRYGYRKIRVLLNREGWQVGKKRVYRLYREEGLTLRQQARRAGAGLETTAAGTARCESPCSAFEGLAFLCGCSCAPAFGRVEEGAGNAFRPKSPHEQDPFIWGTRSGRRVTS
jgi:hypothetical protein